MSEQSTAAAAAISVKLTRLAGRFEKGSELEAELLHAAEQVLKIPASAYSEGWSNGRKAIKAEFARVPA